MNVISVSFGSGSQSSFVWSVGTAVAAGIILFLLNWAREWLTNHLKRTSEASVLAFTVSSQIDEFVSQCSDLVSRGYDFDPESGSVKDQAKPVKLSFSNDLPWSVLDKNLQHRIRSLPNEIDVANRTLSTSWAEEDTDLLDILQEREELYAQIGLTALELNKILHDRYDVPLLDRRNWHPEQIFKESLKTFTDHRAIVRNLQSKVDLTDLIPGPSDEELKLRLVALDADLKSAMGSQEGSRK
ncbi:hypothetical protein ACCS68_26230 [Rhizobium beringeri]|uniref:hypothetical protein n=1 Tax=Rhizobium beringeri TaxID=3019934 RepID=UPI003CE9D6AD